jgi:hypothetical protein
MPEKWAIPEHYKQPRESTPVLESSDDDSSDSDDPLDVIQAGAASTPEPTLFRQSQQHSDADLWQKAYQEEMKAHRVNGTWEIVKLPPGKCAAGSRWFMKVKHNADGSLDLLQGQVGCQRPFSTSWFQFQRDLCPHCSIFHHSHCPCFDSPGGP